MNKVITLTLNPALDRTMFFDVFRAGELNRSTRSVMAPGGKGINVSRVLKACGRDTLAYSFRGGMCGELFANMLAAEELPCRLIETRAETRINIKLMHENGAFTEANEAGGPVLPEEMEKMTRLLLESTDSPQVFVLAGSIPQPVEKSVYNSLTTSLRAAGHMVVMDCDGEALEKGVFGRPHLIKPNVHELSKFVKKPLSNLDEIASAAAGVFVEKEIEVLCTMGGDGALFAGREGIYTVDTPQVKAAGFAGAGDTFLGAFLHIRLDGGDLPDALRFAASAAAAKIEIPGTAVPALEEMKKYMGGLTVRKIG